MCVEVGCWGVGADADFSLNIWPHFPQFRVRDWDICSLSPRPPPPPIAPVFHQVKARGRQRMAGKLPAVSVGGVTRHPPGARHPRDCSLPPTPRPLRTPGWGAGQGDSPGSRSRGSPPWAPPDPGARPGQRGAAAAKAAAGGGLRGARREAWRRDLCGRGVESVCSKPPPFLDPEVRPAAPHALLPSKRQESKRLVSRDPASRNEPPAFPSSDPKRRGSLHPLRSLTQESGISGLGRSKPPAPFYPGTSESWCPARLPPDLSLQPLQSPTAPPSWDPGVQRPRTLTSPSPQRAFSRAGTSAAF